MPADARLAESVAVSHDPDCGHVEPEPSRRVVSIQVVCTSRGVAAAKCSTLPAQHSSLRRLLLADCLCLAASALCSLSGHAELETLDLSRSVQALSSASIAALQKMNGDPLQSHLPSHTSSTCHVVLRGLVQPFRRLVAPGDRLTSIAWSLVIVVKPALHLTGVIRNPQA